MVNRVHLVRDKRKKGIKSNFLKRFGILVLQVCKLGFQLHSHYCNNTILLYHFNFQDERAFTIVIYNKTDSPLTGKEYI